MVIYHQNLIGLNMNYVGAQILTVNGNQQTICSVSVLHVFNGNVQLVHKHPQVAFGNLVRTSVYETDINAVIGKVLP